MPRKNIDVPPAGTPNSPKIAFSPSEAAKLISVGRTFLYAAMNSGALKSVKIGSRRIITLQALQDFLSAHERRPAPGG